MKKTTLLILTLMLAAAAFSQSTIKPKKGDEIKAQIVSTEGAEVEYKLFYFQQGTSFKIAKTDIQFIKYPDGRIENFDTPVSVATPVYSSSGGAELSGGLDKLTKELNALNKGQSEQTKALTETLQALNTNITALKASVEQGNADSKRQNDEAVAKLNSLNNSVKELAETTQSKSSSEATAITPRKFGMGVSFITNYLLGTISDGDGYLLISDNQYSPLFMGAGFNLVISTRMDKKVGFRYEPEFSVASSFNRTKNGNDVVANRISLFSFGSRFLGVARRNRVNIYAGPSLTIFGVVASSRDNAVTSTSAQVGAGFGLHFGGEYLVHSNFGINLESGMQLYGLFPKGGYAEGIFSTYGRLGGRFYF